MAKFFLALYRYFSGHKSIFYSIVIGSAAVFAFFASKISFEENIMSLLPQTNQSEECAIAFGNIKVKDKIFIQIQNEDPSLMDEFVGLLQSKDEKGLIDNILYKLDQDDIMNLLYYGMEALPCHLGEDFYTFLGDTTQIPELPSFYSFSNGHLMSPDKSVVLAFLAPSFDTYDTLSGSELNDLLDECKAQFARSHEGVDVLYHGIVVQSANNSRRIKADLLWTVGISIILICFLILLCFKSKGTLIHLLVPVIYGVLFSLAVMYLIQGEISLLSLGIGAIVLGVAISYCLHVLTHHKFVEDVEDVIREQARPVFLGCLTTIGAFAGLLLTSSQLLRDFGIFASLALIGTTFFSLAFLPQLFSKNGSPKNEKAFNVINRINSYPLHRNRVVVVLMVAVSLVCIFKSGDVKFDNDLNNIGYRLPDELRSESLYNEKINQGHHSMFYAVHASELEEAICLSDSFNHMLDSLKEEGIIYGYSGTEGILVPEEKQRENIALWKSFWTPEHISQACEVLEKKTKGLDTQGFDVVQTFKLMAEADYEPVSLYDAGVVPEALLCNFVEHNDQGYLVFSNVLMDRDRVYQISDIITAANPSVIVMDPFYYTGDMVEVAHKDFNIVLLVSSLFVFLVLLLSFRSLVISVIAFLPMMLSWYIVQGMMAIFGFQFNLINIMISTFVFGIGVDYSIFVMEGLINRAKYNTSRLLFCHKAAIFFSGLILIIVVASLLMAVHPALKSIGISTIIGMTSTILITYALQPLLFKYAIKIPIVRKRILK